MIWMLATLLIPLGTALLCFIMVKSPAWCRRLHLVGALALLGASLMLLRETAADGFVVMQSGDWRAPFGITLVADVLSALMVAITGIIGLTVAVYAASDIEDKLIRKHYFALFHLLLLGVNGAFLTGDLFNLYVWFEVMLIASFVLITLGGDKRQLEGGVKYLVLNLFSSVLFLSGVGLLYGKLGTLNMADIAAHLAASPDALLVSSSGMLLLVAFGIKAALFPFFFWLPASYHTPAVATSALFAGLLTKVGVYALIRLYTTIWGDHFSVVQEILVFLAAATMVTGVLGAAAQFEVRRILSFHIISQIGYMIMGLAIATPLAIAGAIFYVLHHIIVKTNLFLIGGLIMRRCGSGDLKVTGGLYKAAPWLAALFFIPAFSLGGIPPLSGFWAKFSVVQAGLEAERYILVAVALAVGLLTLYSMTKIWAEAFWKASPEDGVPFPSSKKTSPFGMFAPVVVLAVLTLYLGLWSGPLFNLATIASEQLSDPQIYIDNVLGGPSDEMAQMD